LGGWFTTIYVCTILVALVNAIVGIPVSLAGLVCSRGELRALLIAGANCLASVAVVGLFVNAYVAFDSGLRNIYGSASAAPLVIEHMRTHDGLWPRNWDELHETYLKMERPPWSSWEDLRDRTDIDLEFEESISESRLACKRQVSPVFIQNQTPVVENNCTTLLD
jgi:hypothetical protein